MEHLNRWFRRVQFNNCVGALAVSFDLEGLAKRIGTQKYPPVEKWDPDFCGEIDMRIARDGTWFYMGTPIGRKRLVKLFSSVLRRDSDGHHYLVTPVEKLRIKVDDAPLLVVEMTCHGEGLDQVLEMRTLTNDEILVNPDHPIRVETDPLSDEPAPYVRVRGKLDALISRSVFYELVALADKKERGELTELVVWSGGEAYSLGTYTNDV